MDNNTSRFSGDVAIVGDVSHDLCSDARSSVATGSTIDICPNGKSALRLAGTNTRQVWIVAVTLPDMSGFDCIDMLGQICPDAKFFLAADHYTPNEERRAVQLPRTRYLYDISCREMLERLTDASLLSAHFARALQSSSPKPVRGPP